MSLANNGCLLFLIFRDNFEKWFITVKHVDEFAIILLTQRVIIVAFDHLGPEGALRHMIGYCKNYVMDDDVRRTVLMADIVLKEHLEQRDKRHGNSRYGNNDLESAALKFCTLFCNDHSNDDKYVKWRARNPKLTKNLNSDENGVMPDEYVYNIDLVTLNNPRTPGEVYNKLKDAMRILRAKVCFICWNFDIIITVCAPFVDFALNT